MSDNEQPKPDYAAMAEKFEQMAAFARRQEIADGYRKIAEGYRTLAREAAATQDAFSYLVRSQPSRSHHAGPASPGTAATEP